MRVHINDTCGEYAEQECWKTITDITNYEISNFGNVRNRIKGNIMKLNIDFNGYTRISLYKNGKTKTCQIHRLVSLEFIPNPDKKDNSKPYKP